mgnify:CR=1 FL=1
MKEYICIDIGGTSIKHGVVREDGTFAVTGENAHTGHGIWRPPGLWKKQRKIVEVYREEYQPEGICISTAGMVDCEKGKITYAAPLIPNYTRHRKLKKTLEDLYGIPCEVENDVNCAGLAEHFAGASKGSSISLCLTIGTGIGGAIIIDGKVFHGFSGSGCEVGYMHLPGGEFQDLGASSILVKKTAEYKRIDPASINGKYVFEQAKQGEL